MGHIGKHKSKKDCRITNSYRQTIFDMLFHKPKEVGDKKAKDYPAKNSEFNIGLQDAFMRVNGIFIAQTKFRFIKDLLRGPNSPSQKRILKKFMGIKLPCKKTMIKTTAQK